MDPSAAARLDQIATATARDRTLIRARQGAWCEMEDTADKTAAIVDLATALDSIGAAYALIGGVAVGIHTGVPRATLDTDVGIVSTIERASVVAALTAVGFRLVGQYPHSLNFRHPSGEPVQLAFDSGFDAMILRAESMTIKSLSVRIVRKEDLITMKQRAARDPARRKSKALRDQADIELLLGDVPDPDEGW
jgi:hypothetical protein